MTDKKNQKEGVSAFLTDCLLGGVSAAVAKSAATPIEVFKLRLTIADSKGLFECSNSAK